MDSNINDQPPDIYAPSLKNFPAWFTRPGAYTNALGLLTPFSVSFARSFFIQEFRYGIIDLMFRASRALWGWISFRLPLPGFVCGQFVEGDPAYQYVMSYLMANGVGTNSNNYAVQSRGTMKRRGRQEKILGGDTSSGVEYVPNWLSPHLFYWNGYWVEVEGNNQVRSFKGGYEQSISLYVTIYTFRAAALAEFVKAAREQYMEACSSEIIIHIPEGLRRYGLAGDLIWTASKKKQRRPIESVILEDNTLESLLDDARDFLESSSYYRKAGIPHRRGYLLQGPPGTGKSSTIHSLAGELNMEIYALSMSNVELDDASLQRAVSSIPERSILLIEDIDVAFPSREDEDDMDRGRDIGRGQNTCAVTLSGLLNVLDGVTSDDNKLFFATTNYPERLDPALIRPGRIDRKITYNLATARQAAALFKHFFSPDQMHELPSHKDIPADILEDLAQAFSSHIPEKTFATADLQGYLLLYKADPEGAVSNIGTWVAGELEVKRQAEERARAAAERRRQLRMEQMQAQAPYGYYHPPQPGPPHSPYPGGPGVLSPWQIPLPLSEYGDGEGQPAQYPPPPGLFPPQFSGPNDPKPSSPLQLPLTQSVNNDAQDLQKNDPGLGNLQQAPPVFTP